MQKMLWFCNACMAVHGPPRCPHAQWEWDPGSHTEHAVLCSAALAPMASLRPPPPQGNAKQHTQAFAPPCPEHPTAAVTQAVADAGLAVEGAALDVAGGVAQAVRGAENVVRDITSIFGRRLLLPLN